MKRQKGNLKATIVALVALLAIAIVSVIVIGLGELEPISKEDSLIQYLDENGVDYPNRKTMLNLADTICMLDKRDAFFMSSLTETAGFSQEDANYIQFGVLNSDYCEGK